MLTRARSARGGGSGSLLSSSDSTLVLPNGYLTPQHRNTYVSSSEHGVTSLPSSESRLISHGLFQGGPTSSVSNSISKFQNSEFEKVESHYHISKSLQDNNSHTSTSRSTDFSFVDGTSQTSSSVCLASISLYAMASSSGQDSAEDKLDKMMVLQFFAKTIFL
jgi:hypothetical protein